MNLKLSLLCLYNLVIADSGSSRLDNRLVTQSLDKKPNNIKISYDIMPDQGMNLDNIKLDFDGDFLVAIDLDYTPVIIKKNQLSKYKIVAQNATVTPLYLSLPEALLLGNIDLKKQFKDKENLLGSPKIQSIYLVPQGEKKIEPRKKTKSKKRTKKYVK